MNDWSEWKTVDYEYIPLAAKEKWIKHWFDEFFDRTQWDHDPMDFPEYWVARGKDPCNCSIRGESDDDRIYAVHPDGEILLFQPGYILRSPNIWYYWDGRDWFADIDNCLSGMKLIGNDYLNGKGDMTEEQFDRIIEGYPF